MKKIRFHFYEDPETHAYINTLPHWKRSAWVRKATKAQMKQDKRKFSTVTK